MYKFEIYHKLSLGLWFWLLWEINVEKTMDKRQTQSQNRQKEENWLDDVMERQEHDLEAEEEILSSVPNRIKHKWIEE